MAAYMMRKWMPRMTIRLKEKLISNIVCTLMYLNVFLRLCNAIEKLYFMASYSGIASIVMRYLVYALRLLIMFMTISHMLSQVIDEAVQDHSMISTLNATKISTIGEKITATTPYSNIGKKSFLHF